MLHDDSFITGLLIGDKKGYQRGYDEGFEEGGGGSAGARDTIEFGDGMTVDIWKVPTCEKSPVGAAPSLGIEGSTEDTYYNRCVWATRRATYCLAVLEEMYGFEMGTSALEPGTYDPTEDTSDRTVSLWIIMGEWSAVDKYSKCVWCEAAFNGNMYYAARWDDPMWLVVSPTAILCISKLYGYAIPIVVWGFVYAQGTDGGEWRSWTGPGLSSLTALGYDGTAGDLSNPDTTVDDRVGADLVKRNLSSGPLAQVDNFWLIRNTNGLVRDEGGMKIVPNFASVGTSTKHASGRRLIYIAHNASSVVNYGVIYNMYYILLPRGVSQANWRGLLARDIYEGSRHNGGFADYFIYDIENETTPNSYYSGYNKGYEDGLTAGGGGELGGSYDEGYQAGYRDGYAAGVAASGDDDGYTLHPAVDGATELYITIEAVSLRAMQLCICQTVTRGVQIDWGDGTVETLTGTGVVYPEHNYTANGEYVIRLLPTDECIMTLGGGTSVARTVTNDTIAIAASRGCVLRKAVIGKNVVTVGRYAFRNSWNLDEVYVGPTPQPRQKSDHRKETKKSKS